MKRKFTFALVLVMAFSTVSPTLKLSQQIGFLSEVSANTNEIKVTIDGQPVDFTKYGTYPKIVNGTTYVPLRSLFESLGATELTENEENYVGNYPVSMNEIYSFYKNVNGYDVIFTVDTKEKMQPFNSYYMVHYNKENKGALMDLQGNDLILENGRTYLPLKAVSQAFGYKVDWNGSTKTVSIDTSNPTCEGMTIVDGYLNKTNDTANDNSGTPISSNSNSSSSNNINTSTNNAKAPLTHLEQNQLMLEKVNALREEHGLNPLVLDDKLMELAFAKAEDYNLGGYSSDAKGTDGASGNHVSPRHGSARQMYQTMFGEYKGISENFSIRTTTEEYVSNAFGSWENSDAHLKAMLQPNLTKMGFGYAKVNDYESVSKFDEKYISLLEMY